MKQAVSCIFIIGLLTTLCACNTSDSGTSDVTTTSSMTAESITSVSQAISEAPPHTPSIILELPEEAPASQEDNSRILSFDGRDYLVTFNFPSGIYYEGSNIYQTEYGIVPEDIYDPSITPNGPSLKIGAVFADVIGPEQFIGDSVLALPVYDEMVEYTFSDDSSLPLNTFYRLGSTIAVTALGPESGIKRTQYYILCGGNNYFGIWFYQNNDANNAKDFFENVIASILIEPLE